MTAGPGAGAQGLRTAIVTGLDDPKQSGRVKVRLPWLPTSPAQSGSQPAGVEVWARVVSPSAGPKRGMFFLPEVDDEVLVGFEAGRLEDPYVLGGLWNGKDTPPESPTGGRIDRRSVTSRSGHVLRFDDTSGEERIEIIASDGSTRVVIDGSKGTISIEGDRDVEIVSANGAVTIRGREITLQADGETVIKGSKVKIN